MNPTNASNPVTTARFEQARALAALIGIFDPRKLIQLDPDPAAGREALSLLANECTEVERGSEYFWQLNPDSRRSTLDSLRREEKLEQVAKSAGPLAMDDLGKFLVAAILGHDIDLKELNKEQLGALHTALQFAGPVTENAISPSVADNHLARQEMDDAIRMVVPTRLVGRDDALQSLRSFVLAPLSRDALEGNQPPAPMAVSGIGGSGKSALLAEFARLQKGADWQGIPVIWLDFDRAAIATADAVALLLEFSRQLGLYRPALLERLSGFRSAMRGALRYGSESYEGAAALASEAWSLWSFHLHDALPMTEPVVLILDTFEEILLREDSERRHVQRWVESLYKEGKIYGLRPIFSGREVEAGFDHGTFPRQRVITLEDLSTPAAESVLSDQLVQSRRDPAAFPLEPLIDKFGRNPLLLKLLGRFLGEEGPGAVPGLLASDQDHDFRNRFAQAFLYSRILKRIRSENRDVEKLAHPGLVLRRVTPDIIEKILAKPCGLENIDAKRADALFKELARQIWLVEKREGDPAVWHRRDLRRLMLEAMSGTSGDMTGQIHTHAAEYYGNRQDPTLSPADQEVESQYHSLFTAHSRLPSPDATTYFVARIGEDIDNIPLPSRAHLKFAANRVLTPAEVTHLNEDDRHAYEVGRLRTKSRRGEFVELDLVSDMEMSTDGVSSKFEDFLSPDGAATAPDFDLMAELAFTNTDLSFLETHADRVVADFFAQLAGTKKDNPQQQQQQQQQREFVESAIWRLAQYALRRSDLSTLRQLVERQLQTYRHRVEWMRPVRPFDSRSISAATAVEMLLTLLDSRLQVNIKLPRYEPTRIVDTLDGLRAFQLLEDAKIRREVSVRIGLLRYLSDPFLKLIGRGNAASGTYMEQSLEKETLALFGRTPGNRKLSLAEAQQLRSSYGMLTFTRNAFRSDEEALFSGAVPELYPMVRGALRHTKSDTLVAFAGMAQGVSTVWPVELHPAELQTSMEHDRERWLTTLIEISDRCGLLGDLLDHCRAIKSHNAPIQQALSLYNAYEAALSGTRDAE